MSSSGLIYAGIVGAWAVYLVPVWLRREEQLNQAREKARYAAAIRTLGRSEQFEKRWANDEELAATGTDGPVRVPAPTGATAGSATTVKKPAPQPVTPAAAPSAEREPSEARTPPQSPAKAPKKVTLRIDAAGAADGAGGTGTGSGRTKAPAPVLAASQRTRKTVTARVTPQERRRDRRRGVLLMRRRRMVAGLFVLTTLGAVVSAALGVDYIWAMLAPAALMSFYIVNIRRDERQRAKERYRRRQAQLAAERRRERERALLEAQAAVQDARQDAPAWRPTVEPEDYRRAANS